MEALQFAADKSLQVQGNVQMEKLANPAPTGRGRSQSAPSRLAGNESSGAVASETGDGIRKPVEEGSGLRAAQSESLPEAGTATATAPQHVVTEEGMETGGRNRSGGMVGGEQAYIHLGNAIVDYCDRIDEMLTLLNRRELAVSNWKEVVQGINIAQAVLNAACLGIGIASTIVTFGAAAPVLLALTVGTGAAGFISAGAKSGLENARDKDEMRSEMSGAGFDDAMEWGNMSNDPSPGILGSMKQRFGNWLGKGNANEGAAGDKADEGPGSTPGFHGRFKKAMGKQVAKQVAKRVGKTMAPSRATEGASNGALGSIGAAVGSIGGGGVGLATVVKTQIDLNATDPKEVYKGLKFAQLQKELVLLAVELVKNYNQSNGQFNEVLYNLLTHKIKTTNDRLSKYKGG
jgi:hypothetical protein